MPESFLQLGDCLEALPTLEANCIDAVVTDPPYHLTQASRGGSVRKNNPETPFGRHHIGEKGFMGKTWDGGDVAFRPETWAEVLRVAKPGAHLLAFGGTRTFHRLACAIEDAGWEIRDTLMWVYGSGFPKVRTALKPAFEPIILARKKLDGTVAANVKKYGTGGINIDGCRIATAAKDDYGRSATNAQGTIHAHDGFSGKAFAIAERDGEYASPLGRWPANLVHDGSDEVLEHFPTTTSGKQAKGGHAARFFYSAKVSKEERGDSTHPTMKPITLMRWLVKLVAPPGGIVLDPFMGSGSTGVAALAEGFDFMGIDKDPEAYQIAEKRVASALTQACPP